MSGRWLMTRTLGGLLGLASMQAALAAGSGAAGDDLRLGRSVVPASQSIQLKLDPDKAAYEGSVDIDLDVMTATDSFRFHADQMDLKVLTLESATGSVALSHEAGPIGLVTVKAPSRLAPGRYTLHVQFGNDFGTRAVGLYRVQLDGRGYAFTQFEADDAREAFPCWDEPDFKIPYQFTLTIPEGHTALTNTPVEKETAAAGLKTLTFARTKPLPSYLLAIASGPLEYVPIEGMSIPGRVVSVKGKSGLAGTAAAMTPPLLAAMEKYFGGRYPFEKLDLIAIPDYWPGAMENPGAITFVDTLLLQDPKSASMSQRRGLASITSHELAHMWFGDLVTMRWWDDLWLNESFADWLGDKIAQQVHPEFNIGVSERQSTQNTMTGDARPSAQAIRREILPTDNMLENVGTQYNKGKAVLGMFERWVGPEAFRKGVLAYLKAHEFGNATAGDLWAALSQASGKDVAGAMATFIDQPGLPLVRVEPAADGSLILGQRRFLNHGVEAPAQLWQIPVVLAYSDGKARRTHSVLLKGERQSVRPEAGGPPAWVLPDAGAEGYYRWAVPAPMLQELAARSADLMDPRERVGFIGNLSALLTAGEIHGDEYLAALGRFADDPHPQVLSSLALALSNSRMPLVPEDRESAYAAYVRATLGPALARFGMAAKPGEEEAISLFRPRLLEMLGKDGHDAKVLDHAESLARAYMAAPSSVDPSLAGVALQLAATRGDRHLFEEYRKRFEAATVPAERTRYLEALGYFRVPELVEEALAYSIKGPLRPREIFDLAGDLGETASGRERLYRYMTENYDALTARLPEQSAGFMPFFASGCEPERVEAARTFFADPARDRPGTRSSLAKVADQVADCARLRQREGASASAYLGSLGPDRAAGN